jgi:putative acetyltransferase
MGLTIDGEEIKIRPFEPSDQAAVKQMILDGLVDHWGFLDSTKNPDLNDITRSYSNADFLVATLKGSIAGCGALTPIDSNTGEIVRMSVDRSLRHKGIGTIVLNRLLQIAYERQYQKVILETTSTWYEVIAFYIRNGFQITHQLGDDTYFEYIIQSNLPNPEQ